MNRFEKTALLFLCALGFVAWGYSIARFEVFPHALIAELEAFVVGGEVDADTGLGGKLLNDAGLAPVRSWRRFPEQVFQSTERIKIPGMKFGRRVRPRMYLDADHAQGYRGVFGALDLRGSFWGGILFGPGGDPIHTWRLSTDSLDAEKDNEFLRNLYGLHVFPDGSVIFTQQERGGGIVKVDACSNVLWGIEGIFHHTITPTESGHFWTFQGMQEDLDHRLEKRSVATGELVAAIDMADVRKANPLIQIFDLENDLEAPDQSHGNDIDVLSKAYAAAFPQFQAGDLLLSYRTHNLIFVLDPETLEIKWWRVGSWGRQHDPDWEADGRISVFSNNNRNYSEREYSDIVVIDPNSYEIEVAVDGEKFEFYSFANGMHELTPYGTRLIASSTQGWVFEVDQNNEIVFSFLNFADADKRKALHISDARRYDETYFESPFWETCSR